jgi:hypothetical protein
MAFGTRVQFEAVREIASGSIGASYSAVGSATIDHSRLVVFANSTDAEVYISLDGTTNHLRFAPNSFKIFDFTTNKVRDDGLFIDIGTVFYIKRVSAAPTSGTFWIEVMYAAGGI